MATLANFGMKWGGTARNACVSAVGKAEEATCNGGTFASSVERWKLAFFGEKWGRTT